MLLWCELGWQCVEEERVNTLNLESLKCLYLCHILVDLHYNLQLKLVSATGLEPTIT